MWRHNNCLRWLLDTRTVEHFTTICVTSRHTRPFYSIELNFSKILLFIFSSIEKRHHQAKDMHEGRRPWGIGGKFLLIFQYPSWASSGGKFLLIFQYPSWASSGGKFLLIFQHPSWASSGGKFLPTTWRSACAGANIEPKYLLIGKKYCRAF